MEGLAYKVGDTVVRRRNTTSLNIPGLNAPIGYVGVVSKIDGLGVHFKGILGGCREADFDLFVEPPKVPTLEELRVALRTANDNIRDLEEELETAFDTRQAARNAWDEAVAAIDYPVANGDSNAS